MTKDYDGLTDDLTGEKTSVLSVDGIQSVDFVFVLNKGVSFVHRDSFDFTV